MRRFALPVVRLAALVALGFSTALLIDYLKPIPSFCALGSGCSKVKSMAGYVGGVPIPALGVAAFSSLLALSLWPGGRTLAKWGAVGGGAVAIGLVAWQVLGLGALCWMCAVVDGSAVVGAAFALLWRPTDAHEERLLPMGWAGLVLLAAGLPTGIARARPAPKAPDAILALNDPAAVTIVEFSDFECPFCRLMHPVLEEAKSAAGTPVRIVRKTFPLPAHRHARDASRAWVCAAKAGKGDAMADWLFTSDDLDEPAITARAAALGLDAPTFAACVGDPATDAAIDADIAFVRGIGFEGLPTTWVGDRKFLGAQPVGTYVDAIRAVARGDRPAQDFWPIAVVGVASLMMVLAGWKRRDAS